MPPVPSEGEISPLRSAAVEMTGMGGFFYNLRPKGATITLGPKGRRPLSEAMHSEHILKERSDAQNVVSRFPCGDITRRRQAATTFGPEGRQPSPLNSLNLMNPLNPHTEGVSNGEAATTEPGGAQGRLFHKKNSPFGESIHKGEDAYLSLVRQSPRSQLRRKRRRCSISGVEGSSCSISRMASFSLRPERKMRRYAFFR